jgi:hypothetical protein
MGLRGAPRAKQDMRRVCRTVVKPDADGWRCSRGQRSTSRRTFTVQARPGRARWAMRHEKASSAQGETAAGTRARCEKVRSGREVCCIERCNKTQTQRKTTVTVAARRRLRETWKRRSNRAIELLTGQESHVKAAKRLGKVENRVRVVRNGRRGPLDSGSLYRLVQLLLMLRWWRRRRQRLKHIKTFLA